MIIKKFKTNHKKTIFVIHLNHTHNFTFLRVFLLVFYFTFFLFF
jgi:hypothetical protein